MAGFNFSSYGTFTGPGSGYRFDNTEPNWYNIPTESGFALNDVAMVLINNTSDYVYLHLNGTNTDSITLEKNTGQISTFNVDVILTTFTGSVRVDVDLGVTGTFSASAKFFDIPHPSKDGMRLKHGCLEGPENAVYIRGRITGSNVIPLPDYWKDLVNTDTITVSLTEIGYDQNLVVSNFDSENIRIRSMCGSNIDCFYFVQAERKDIEKLVVETPLTGAPIRAIISE
jgi:hypothetical protein